ncbi:TetR family transcriptional regulator [Stenotrophomonas sp. MMGLT7]|uniref:TetR/AcrR family transcriptional regulator n=1 Tax=Stenotrophomonas sp. MMGLT7 TaxID=2901227 RepID=UPI001E4AAD9A|nr:TetR family transcriptional regulator [Stenotrophomonas sp. MMGLT7]MCD7097343.1 TetR family transcriptional regulator [Stenotrophomonas sp. MMGLT7]
MNPTPIPLDDGRRLRGEARRRKLIAATLAVVERDGVAGVTHRSVAKQAGVSASSAIYYFATLDDLLLAALTAAAQAYAEQLEALVASGRDEIDGIAEMIAEASGCGRQRALAERELTLQAARRPALRPIAQHWRTLVARAAGRHTSDPLTIQAVVAVADGICAKALLEDEAVPAAAVNRLLRQVIGSAAPGTG